MSELWLQVVYSLFWIAVLGGVAGVFWAIISYQERTPRNTSATSATGMQLPVAPMQPSASQHYTSVAPMQPSAQPNTAPVQARPIAGSAWVDAPDDDWGVAPIQTGVQTIKLSTLAQSDNILVVGQKGAGKTTLLRKIVAKRRDKGEQLIALDPHAKPGKWPCYTVGGGRDYDAIQTALIKIETDMDSRFKQMAKGEIAEGEFPRRATVSDEYRSITDKLNGKGETVNAGSLMLSRISEGRKVGECALVACHNDTAEALGIQGNTDMKTCFDYIVYMGALVDSNRTYKAPADVKREAKALARPAIAWHPERNNWYVLEDDIPMDEIEAMASSTFIELPNSLNSGSTHSDAVEPVGSGSMNSKNTTIENPNLTIDEVVKVSKTLELYRKTGNKIEAIERVFKVSRGGSKEYLRSKFIVDMVLEKEKVMELN